MDRFRGAVSFAISISLSRVCLGGLGGARVGGPPIGSINTGCRYVRPERDITIFCQDVPGIFPAGQESISAAG
jgi:hypothetical protein